MKEIDTNCILRVDSNVSESLGNYVACLNIFEFLMTEIVPIRLKEKWPGTRHFARFRIPWLC